MSFTNPARKDNAVLHHWRRTCDEGKEYPFAVFNKVKCVQSLCMFTDMHLIFVTLCDLFAFRGI